MNHSFHIQVTAAAKTTTFHFKRKSVRIGRLPDNDLVLPDASVDERVGWLEVRDYGEDFKLQRPTGKIDDYNDGDSLRIGRYGLTLIKGDPPSEREEEFLAHLRTHPADDQARLVYGDWLEENGRANAAEFIRAQVSLATLEPDTDDFQIAKDKLHVYGDGLPGYWRRTIARPPIEGCDVRFELQCPKQWGDLAPTYDPNQRYCGTCAKTVHYAPNVKAARRLALAGECVVVDVVQLRRPGDLEAEDERRYMMAGMISPPSDWPSGE